MRRRGIRLRWRAPRVVAACLVTAATLVFAGSASALGGPVNITPPSISGSAVQGQTLACSPGTWTPAPTGYSYSWQRDITTTIASSGSTYTVSAADVGHAITCTVVATDSLGTSLPAVSVPPVVPLSAPVGLVPVATGTPAISGSAIEGKTVACSPGSWLNGPTSYTYSWQRDALAIAGQAASRYTLTVTDVGQAITCTVVARNASGDSLPAISAPIIPALASVGGGGSGGSSGGGSGAGGASGNPGKPGSGPKVQAPTLKALWITPSTMTVVVRGKRRSTKGTTFHFTIDRRASVLIEVWQRVSGRLKDKRCVAVGRRNAKAERCSRWVELKVLSVRSAAAGSGRIRYSGRVGKHLLAPGVYRVYAAAANAAGWSKLRSAQFSVRTKSFRPRGGQKADRRPRTARD